MANYIVAKFTESGSPKTGLTPKIYIYLVSDGSTIINGSNMTEIANGGYQYDFTTWDSATDYYVVADSVSLTGNERYAFATIDAPRIIEGTHTTDDILRLVLSFIGGETSGGKTTSVTFRDVGDTKDRIVMTVDNKGNRSTVALDGT